MSREKKEKEIDNEMEVRVLRELPTQEITKAKDENGIEYELITIEDALKEILVKIREIHEAL